MAWGPQRPLGGQAPCSGVSVQTAREISSRRDTSLTGSERALRSGGTALPRTDSAESAYFLVLPIYWGLCPIVRVAHRPSPVSYTRPGVPAHRLWSLHAGTCGSSLSAPRLPEPRGLPHAAPHAGVGSGVQPKLRIPSSSPPGCDEGTVSGTQPVALTSIPPLPQPQPHAHHRL